MRGTVLLEISIDEKKFQIALEPFWKFHILVNNNQ